MKEKKLLVVNFYGSCVGCPCRRYSEETDISECNVLYKVIPEGTKVLEECPLRSLQRIDGSEGKSAEEIRYIQGWNAALDQIELG